MGMVLALTCAWAIAGAAGDPAAAEGPASPVRALVVSGGHDFEREAFFAAFDAMPGIEWTEATQPGANDRYTREAASQYDVLVLYDMVQAISEQQQQDLVRLLREDGKGLVALHHSIADYQQWPEYRDIIGARYYLTDATEGGVGHAKSTFDHDQRFTVRIVDPRHPITKGMQDFEIEDETYAGFDVDPGVNVLLRTDYPKSGPVIGWTKTYGNARVAYIQLGHGPSAYANDHFRRLVGNALRWAARREPAV